MRGKQTAATDFLKLPFLSFPSFSSSVRHYRSYFSLVSTICQLTNHHPVLGPRSVFRFHPFRSSSRALPLSVPPHPHSPMAIPAQIAKTRKGSKGEVKKKSRHVFLRLDQVFCNRRQGKIVNLVVGRIKCDFVAWQSFLSLNLISFQLITRMREICFARGYSFIYMNAYYNNTHAYHA